MASTVTKFIPRATFPPQLSLPRSYFLGHHAAGLAQMKTMLSSVDLVLECRDYRVPLTSRNPLFEDALAGRERIILYTKRDLGSNHRASDRNRESLVQQWTNNTTLFTDHKSPKDMKKVINIAKERANLRNSLLGTRILIVGMPNVGKSSLINALRKFELHKAKAAHTGAQPGITRKIASGVKIVEKNEENGTEGVYVIDTPGVFIPFVPDPEAMMKLALVGCVKDTIISPITLCDYLLYIINKQQAGPKYYSQYCAATNDVEVLLTAVCHKTGKLGRGGVPELDAAALWVIQRWRSGEMGFFTLDEVTENGLGLEDKRLDDGQLSLNRAKWLAKEAQRSRRKAVVGKFAG